MPRQGGKALAKGPCQPRLGHSRWRRQKNDLAVALVNTVPTLPHRADFVGAADQRHHALAGSSREAADGAILADDCPDAGRPWNPLEGLRPKIFVAEGGAG